VSITLQFACLIILLKTHGWLNFPAEHLLQALAVRHDAVRRRRAATAAGMTLRMHASSNHDWLSWPAMISDELSCWYLLGLYNNFLLHAASLSLQSSRTGSKLYHPLAPTACNRNTRRNMCRSSCSHSHSEIVNPAIMSLLACQPPTLALLPARCGVLQLLDRIARLLKCVQRQR